MHIMRLNDIISEQTTENRLKNFCEIKEGFPDADFWLQRRGDVKTVGQPLKEYSPENIGIKVTSTDILDPKFLYYAMLHLHSQGYWRNKTRGILNLVHIKVSDVQNVPVSQKLDEQEKNGKLSVEDIHNLADFKCVKWDSDPKFLKKTKELTGKEHLDDLDQSGLEKIYTWLNSLPDKINEKRDACYYKVKRRYKIWPSAYGSGALVQCRKKGAKNWGKKSK